MAIYRGAGGPGDATTDAANQASVASNKATEAAASAAAAALSATSASSSASTATTAATSAGNSATSAASSASAAASSASSASSSASSAGSALSSALLAQAAAEAAQVAAETAETNAETAQSAAEDAQTAAEAAQVGAETAETNAETAQAAAEAARDAALSALSNFDDRYFGSFVDDAAVATYASAEGFTIDSGDLYFNTTSDNMKVYDGSAWLNAYTSGGALDDLDDVIITSASTGQLLKYNGTNWVNGTIVTDLVGDTTPQLGGALDTNGYAINFGDNDKATFGDSEDLWLYHDGGTSYLYDRGTGNLRIITNSTVSIDGVSGGEFMATFVSNGAVSLYYDNSNKFQTTSTGVNVTGNIAVSGTVDGRDIATDGTKLDGIEALADVTDATNVAAAGAVMDTDFSTNGLMKRTGAGTYTIVTDNSSEWDTAYGWGNHASAGYLTTDTYTGTVTSVNMSVPTGLTVSGGPITSLGTFTVAFDTGYSIPTTVKQSNWDDSYTFVAAFPSQSGNSGKFLTTDGSSLSFATVDADPAGTAVALAIALG